MKTRTFRVGRRGHIAETAYDTYMAYVYNRGRRERRCFKSFRDAEAYILAIEANMSLAPLTNAQIVDAQLAYRILPQGLSLQEVVLDYIRTRPVNISTIKLSHLAKEYIAARNFRPDSKVSYNTSVQYVIDRLGDRYAHEYTTEECRILVAQAVTSSKALNIIKVLHAIYEWGMKHDKVGANVWSKIERPKQAETSIDILSVSQAEQAIRAIQEQSPECVWYYAIGLFAGVRPKELVRIKPKHIKDGYIYLDGSITKTKSTRSIKIQPNLAVWLAQYPIQPTTTYMILKSHKIIVDAINLESYPNDILRHSFASYLYEMTHDAALVASELGHTTTTMLFKHYRALAPAGSGAEYFSIVPK